MCMEKKEKNTNFQSCYKFKLSACKEAAAGREGTLKTTNCKCLCFSLKMYILTSLKEQNAQNGIESVKKLKIYLRVITK